MDIREARLRAMLDVNSEADWNLNSEDREAIRWALLTIDRARKDRDHALSDSLALLRRVIAFRNSIDQAVSNFREELPAT
jgi:hypothetical protein